MELWFGCAMAKLFLIKSNVADYPSTGAHKKYVSISISLKCFSGLFHELFFHPPKILFFSFAPFLEFHFTAMRKFCSEIKSVFLRKTSSLAFSILNICFSLKKFFFSSSPRKLTKTHDNTFVSRKTRKIIFLLFRLFSSLNPEDASNTSFNPRRRGWWMNDHDIVTIDQKQKLINKTEKYKNMRKENFFLLPYSTKHYGMKKFLNSTTIAVSYCVPTGLRERTE